MPARGTKVPRTAIGDAGDRHSIEAHLVEFAEWMGVRGYSPRTIDDRIWASPRFVETR